MGVVNRRWMWVESMGVVVRRYIDYLILLIPTPLVSVLFYTNIPTFCSFKKNVFNSLKLCNNQFNSWSRSCTGLRYDQANVLRCRFQTSSCKLHRKELKGSRCESCTCVNSGRSRIKAHRLVYLPG